MRTIAPRACIAESATLRISAKAKRIAAASTPDDPRVITLSVGEPDFHPPSAVVQRTTEYIQGLGGRLTYTPAAGRPELRRVIAAKIEERTGLRYDPDREIIVTVGGKHGIAEALLATAPPGTRVLIPAPYWLSYPAMVAIAGAEPIILDCLSTDMKLQPSTLREAGDPRNAVLILNSPSNPTGAVYRREELESLRDEILRQDLWVITDEIYDRLLYGDAEHVSFPTLPEMRERTILVNGISKTYAMTGWRIGFVAGPEEVVRAMRTLQSHMTSNPCAGAQEAALAALEVPERELQEHLAGPMEDLKRRRRMALELLGEIQDLRALPPQGAFYILLDVRAFMGRPLGREKRVIQGDGALAELLLEEGRIALAPGGPFGAPGFLRLSFAVPDEDLREGIRRLATMLAGA